MKLNKKGFTLIEILAIVVLIGVVAVIAIPNITKQADEHATKQTKLLKEQITNAAKIYFSKDKIDILLDTTKCVGNDEGEISECEVSVDKLVELELLTLSNNEHSGVTKVYITRNSAGKIDYKIK